MSASRYRRSHLPERRPDVGVGLSRQAVQGMSPEAIADRSRSAVARREAAARGSTALGLASRVEAALPPARPKVAPVPTPTPKAPETGTGAVLDPLPTPWRAGGLRISTTRPSQQAPAFTDDGLVALSSVQKERPRSSRPASSFPVSAPGGSSTEQRF